MPTAEVPDAAGECHRRGPPRRHRRGELAGGERPGQQDRQVRGHRRLRGDQRARSARHRAPNWSSPPAPSTYGSQYAFTVVAINDGGAGSKASPLSGTVVPFTLPDAPDRVAGRHSGRPAGHHLGALGSARSTTAGRSRRTWWRRAGARREVTDRHRPRSAASATARTCTVKVRAVNEAGPGPQATATARTVAAPQVTITRTSVTATSVTVAFDRRRRRRQRDLHAQRGRGRRQERQLRVADPDRSHPEHPVHGDDDRHQRRRGRQRERHRDHRRGLRHRHLRQRQQRRPAHLLRRRPRRPQRQRDLLGTAAGQRPAGRLGQARHPLGGVLQGARRGGLRLRLQQRKAQHLVGADQLRAAATTSRGPGSTWRAATTSRSCPPAEPHRPGEEHHRS